MKIEKAVERANQPKGKQDQEAVQALRDHFGAYAALWIADNLIDGEKSQQAMDALQDATMTRFPGGKYKNCVTVAEWLQAGKSRKEADPLTGVMLIDGVSTDQDEVDWSKVPKDRRLLALWAKQTNRLARIDADTRFRVAEELAQPTLTKMWPNIESEVKALKASEREALEEELYFQPATRPFVQAAEPPFPGEAAVKCAADGGISCPGSRGACAGPGEVGRCGRRVMPYQPNGPADAAPKTAQVYLLVADADKAAANRLRVFLKPSLGGAAAGSDVVTIGDSVQRQRCDGIRQASVVVPLLSADLLADDDMVALLEFARAQGQLIMPVMLRKCVVTGWLSGMASLPRTGIMDSDEKMYEVVRELGKALR